jgi:protein-S-isoprenylcysteine O-methyltransferase Ste14
VAARLNRGGARLRRDCDEIAEAEGLDGRLRRRGDLAGVPAFQSTISSKTDFSSRRFTRMEVGLIWFEGRTIPRWTGALHGIVQPAVHAGIPWLLSRLGPRYGWTAEGPGVWNLAGLISIIAGCALMTWCLVVHMRLAPAGWRIEKTPYYPTPAYLATEGPYRFSRNPIYVAEGMIWIGWMVFFGSLVILAVLATLAYRRRSTCVAS